MVSDVLAPNRINGNDRALSQPERISSHEADHIGVVADQPPVRLSAFVHVLRRRWKLALPIAGPLAIAAALVAWNMIEPKYAASAFLRIDSDERPLIFQTADQAGIKINFNLYKNTQKQLMVAPFVLAAALHDDDVRGIEEVRLEVEPVEWVGSHLVAEFPGDGEIMEVTFVDEDESDSVAIVNAVVNAYMNEVVIDERNKRLKRLDNLERVYAEAEGKVRQKQSGLKTLADSLGTGNSESLTVAQENAIQQFGFMQERLSDVQFKLMEAEGNLSVAKTFEQQVGNQLAEAIKKDEATTDPADATVSAIEQSRIEEKLKRMDQEMFIEQAGVEQLLASFGVNHPNVASAIVQMRAKKRMLDKERKYVEEQLKASLDNGVVIEEESEDVARLKPSHESAKSKVLGLETTVAVLRNQEKIVSAKVESLEAETRQLGRSSIDIELMRSEIDGLEQVLARVGEEIERTSIELKTASRIQLIGPAEAASPEGIKKRIVASVMMAATAFCLPFGLLGIWDVSRKKVNDLRSVSTALPFANLGTIPLVSKRTLANAGSAKRKKHVRERAKLIESIDSLAAMVRYRSESERRKVFMVTSAQEGEGKTTVACQLAQSLARSGTRVLLVDFDCRRPGVHRVLGIEQEPGVCDVLVNRVEWQDAVHKMDDLCVLTAGRSGSHVHQREVSGEVAELFFRVRQQFDLVIVDGCPVLPVVDARVIGTYCDGAILTLIRDVSRLPSAATACEMLGSYDVDILGTVVIGAGQAEYGYGNRYFDRPELST